MFGFIKRKLRDIDWLGQSPQLTYRREGGYGTALGGFCTLTALLLVMLFVTSEFYGLIMQPTYS